MLHKNNTYLLKQNHIITIKFKELSKYLLIYTAW